VDKSTKGNYLNLPYIRESIIIVSGSFLRMLMLLQGYVAGTVQCEAITVQTTEVS
jgi:hypothetical protein